MTDDQKKQPGVAFWATVVVVVVLVAYPLSFGPACWWMSRSVLVGVGGSGNNYTMRFIPAIYRPIAEIDRPISIAKIDCRRA